MKQQNLNKNEIIKKTTPIIEKITSDLNLIPLEINLVQEGGRWFLRIFIFSHDHQITHEDCEAVTRGLNEQLDELIPVNYYLEVSSPGLDRKLKSSKEYEVFKGKNIQIKLKKALNENEGKVFSAKILDYNPQGILEVEKVDNKSILNIEETNISSAKLILE